MPSPKRQHKLPTNGHHEVQSHVKKHASHQKDGHRSASESSTKVDKWSSVASTSRHAQIPIDSPFKINNELGLSLEMRKAQKITPERRVLAPSSRRSDQATAPSIFIQTACDEDYTRSYTNGSSLKSKRQYEQTFQDPHSANTPSNTVEMSKSPVPSPRALRARAKADQENVLIPDQNAVKDNGDMLKVQISRKNREPTPEEVREITPALTEVDEPASTRRDVTESLDLDPEEQQIRQEIDADFKGLYFPRTRYLLGYEPIGRLGEGTFSAVYKAIDHTSAMCENPWAERVLGKKSQGKVHVALKRIFVTSAPDRIYNELEILWSLRETNNVSPLITALRLNDQVIAVMPFHHNDDFRFFYKKATPTLLRTYFKCLFSALAGCSDELIMHRDVKPANFLFDVQRGTGFLCDFGLAQRLDLPRRRCNHVHTPETLKKYPHGQALEANTREVSRAKATLKKSRSDIMENKVGYMLNDRRPTIKANRAGTRGFRAPEVLFKCQDQNMALDVWAAGIILLSFLTARFPFFTSNDDAEALMEIATIFGAPAMQNCGMLHNRTFCTNVAHLGTPRDDPLRTLIKRINPDFFAKAVRRSSRTRAKDDDGIIVMDVDPQEGGDSIEVWTHNEIQDVLSLLRSCLELDLTKRITARDALSHKFLQPAHLTV